ncbi:MAG: haloacid dehalogenase-like hydrolase [Elusimicrobiales bacterium]|jgi:phosphoserine phosphatase
MKLRKLLNSALVISVLYMAAPVCRAGEAVMRNIEGFSKEANAQLGAFLAATRNEKGRKVAVFDGDGTVIGQVPHYLADECLYGYAKKHPERKPELIDEMRGQSNVSLPYVQNRVRYFAGESAQFLRGLGKECFAAAYSKKIFQPMRRLIDLLKENGFEIWVVSASPEAMYQQFLSEAFKIPVTNIIGVRSVIRQGIITDEIIPPVPQDKGKKEAVETFIQETPLLAAGNSRGDREMIEFSRGLRIMVNPDEHIEAGEKESVADYAKRNDWLTVRMNDIPEKDFPAVSSNDYGIRLNKAWAW